MLLKAAIQIFRCISACPVTVSIGYAEKWGWNMPSHRFLHGRGSGRGKRRAPLVGEVQHVEEEMQADEHQAAAQEDLRGGAHFYGDGERSGLHVPVMLEEVISFFAPVKNQVFLDMTFGSGGHTQALLKSAPGVTVYALDRDPIAYQIADRMGQYCEGRLLPMLGRFSELQSLLSQRGMTEHSLDGILIDAGCSFIQFDSPERGFSLSQDGPLDMRMDGDRFPMQPTAADVVNSVDFSTLTKILQIYGEESNAKKIAQAIIDYRTNFQLFTTTQELATVVACTFTHSNTRRNRDKLGRRSHMATKTFQALRIFVNNELNELAVGLAAAREALKPGGKLAVLSFHSLEDRVVKRTLQGRNVAEKGSSLREKRLGSSNEDEDGSGWKVLKKKVLSADADEVENNPRARSAKLRTAVKV